MRKTRFFSAITGCLLAAAMMFASCSDEVGEELFEGNPRQVPAEVINKLQTLGFNTEGIRMDGDNYLIEGDIAISPEALAEMGKVNTVSGESGEELYRGTNLVNGFRTITIRSYISSGPISTGINYAINNYNAVNLPFTFQRVYSGEGDITIYPTTGVSFSGFPSNGDPYPYIYVYSSIQDNQKAECVITHHIGHCIGVVHTNPFEPSCDPQTATGVYVPGTPTYNDPYSIFNSCACKGTTNGEFSSGDRMLLSYYY